MALPTLYGPYSLTNPGVDGSVTNTSAGVYALGVERNGTFYISRVGRSDIDLGGRLKQQVGTYPQFKAAYCSNSYEAFVFECELFHEYGGANNPMHPDRAKGQNWTCPRCTTF
jgi:hypothetical protein